MDSPPLLADLVPRRIATYFVCLFGGVAIIVLLGALYIGCERLASMTTDGRVAAFDLDSEGSIASWFSIVILALCGQGALLVRRLRLAAGSSRAEARAWLAVSVAWLTMSLDEGASLHEAFKELMARIIGSRVFGDGSIYWVVPYSVMLAACGTFMLVATRRTKYACASLVAAGASYAAAVVMQFEIVFPTRPAVSTWIEESCELLGGMFVLMTLGLQARTVIAGIEESTTRAASPVARTAYHPDSLHRLAPLARAG